MLGDINWSVAEVVVSIVGILIGVVVTLWTSRSLDLRARRQRWLTTKAMILRDLAPSLGEGDPPSLATLQAMIRSVLRANDIVAVDAFPFEEITDDLIRQITADPFLTQERRQQLQQQLLDLAEQARPLVPAGSDAGAAQAPRTQGPPLEFGPSAQYPQGQMIFSGLFMALALVGIVVVLVLGANQHPLSAVALVGGALIFVLLLVWALTRGPAGAQWMYDRLTGRGASKERL
jgi:hypothetical protein